MTSKKSIIGYGINFVIVAIAFILMVFGGLKFLIISLIFFGGGGVFEFIIMNRFHGKVHKKISIKDSFGKKIKNGIYWVHGILIFIALYGTTIYDFKKIGYLPSIASYLTMLIYVLISLLYFQYNGSYFAFIFYLILVVTNLLCFFMFHYFVYRAK